MLYTYMYSIQTLKHQRENEILRDLNTLGRVVRNRLSTSTLNTNSGTGICPRARFCFKFHEQEVQQLIAGRGSTAEINAF